MRSLDARLERVEVALGIGENSASPDPHDTEEEERQAAWVRAATALLETMSEDHVRIILDEWEYRQLSSEEMSRLISEGKAYGAYAANAKYPYRRYSDLTYNFEERVKRHLRGDQRPLALPSEVARVYLERGAGRRFTRECLSCGYDVLEIERNLPAVIFPICPLCGGEYEPIQPGHGVRFSRHYTGWSNANRYAVEKVW